MRERIEHPLAPYVLELLSEHMLLDVSTLFVALSGATQFSGKYAARATKAYTVVARDVLESMVDFGTLMRDGSAYRKNK